MLAKFHSAPGHSMETTLTISLPPVQSLRRGTGGEQQMQMPVVQSQGHGQAGSSTMIMAMGGVDDVDDEGGEGEVDEEVEEEEEGDEGEEGDVKHDVDIEEPVVPPHPMVSVAQPKLTKAQQKEAEKLEKQLRKREEQERKKADQDRRKAEQAEKKRQYQRDRRERQRAEKERERVEKAEREAKEKEEMERKKEEETIVPENLEWKAREDEIERENWEKEKALKREIIQKELREREREDREDRERREKEKRDKEKSVSYKDKFHKMRERYDRVTTTHEDYERDLDILNAKMKKLQAENDLLLDALYHGEPQLYERYFPRSRSRSPSLDGTYETPIPIPHANARDRHRPYASMPPPLQALGRSVATNNGMPPPPSAGTNGFSVPLPPHAHEEDRRQASSRSYPRRRGEYQLAPDHDADEERRYGTGYDYDRGRGRDHDHEYEYDRDRRNIGRERERMDMSYDDPPFRIINGGPRGATVGASANINGGAQRRGVEIPHERQRERGYERGNEASSPTMHVELEHERQYNAVHSPTDGDDGDGDGDVDAGREKESRGEALSTHGADAAVVPVPAHVLHSPIDVEVDIGVDERIGNRENFKENEVVKEPTDGEKEANQEVPSVGLAEDKMDVDGDGVHVSRESGATR